MSISAYIERQKSPVVHRKLDPGFNSVGLNDGRGNLVELQINAETGRWAVAVLPAGKESETVGMGEFTGLSSKPVTVLPSNVAHALRNYVVDTTEHSGCDKVDTCLCSRAVAVRLLRSLGLVDSGLDR